MTTTQLLHRPCARTREPRLGRLPGTPEKRRAIRQFYGRPSELMDPAGVRDHIAYLRRWGLACAAIAEAAGVSDAMVRLHANGKRDLIHRRYARAILGVTLVPHPAQTRPLSIGARRRVQALAVAGWPFEVQGQRLGLGDRNCVSDLVSKTTVLGRYHWAVVSLFDELCMQRGPSELTSSRAVARGWSPALAWDDDTIDDPRAKPCRSGPRLDEPDEVLVRRVMEGRAQLTHLRPKHRHFVVAHLTGRGLSANEIAELVGTAERTVVRLRGAAASLEARREQRLPVRPARGNPSGRRRRELADGSAGRDGDRPPRAARPDHRRDGGRGHRSPRP